MMSVLNDQEPVEMAEATGAGLIWFMGRDHLSPPLSNADHFALDSTKWRQAQQGFSSYKGAGV